MKTPQPTIMIPWAKFWRSIMDVELRHGVLVTCITLMQVLEQGSFGDTGVDLPVGAIRINSGREAA